MDPFFHTGLSISDSLKTVRKSVLIYETIIEIIPAKVVYVRNRNKRKEYLCLISTDVNLDENEIIRIYGKHWDIMPILAYGT